MSDTGSSQPGAIEVNTSFIFLAFLLYFFKTRVVIDGQLYELPWGTNTFPVHPGRHRVRVSFKYLFPSDAGANEIDVEVGAGQTVQVRYRAPWLIFLQGKLTATGSAAAVANAAGWFPDPGNKHEMRYYDGQTWTTHVSDQGVSSDDPL